MLLFTLMRTLTLTSTAASGGQGPVVQSILSLTSSLRGQLVKYFTTLQPNTLLFLLKKGDAFAVQKLLTFFNTFYWRTSDINILNFYQTLNNDVISFEQPGTDVLTHLFLVESSK